MYQKIITQTRPQNNMWWWTTGLDSPQLYTSILITTPGYIDHTYVITDNGLTCISEIIFETKEQWEFFHNGADTEELIIENGKRIQYNIDHGISHVEEEKTI